MRIHSLAFLYPNRRAAPSRFDLEAATQSIVEIDSGFYESEPPCLLGGDNSETGPASSQIPTIPGAPLTSHPVVPAVSPLQIRR